MKDKRKREGIKKAKRIGKAKSSQGNAPKCPSAIHYHPPSCTAPEKRVLSLRRNRCVQYTLVLFGPGNNLFTITFLIPFLLLSSYTYFSHDEQTELNNQRLIIVVALAVIICKEPHKQDSFACAFHLTCTMQNAILTPTQTVDPHPGARELAACKCFSFSRSAKTRSAKQEREYVGEPSCFDTCSKLSFLSPATSERRKAGRQAGSPFSRENLVALGA